MAVSPRITQLDASLKLPDGRRVPVVVTLNLGDIESNGAANDNPDPLVLRAVEVFGKADKAISWLNSPNPAFSGKSPREAASTEDGRRAVLEVLLDLEHGFPA